MPRNLHHGSQPPPGLFEMWKRWLPLILFAALGVLFYAGIQLNRERDPNAIPSPLIGKPLPSFTLPLLHEPEKTIASSELIGQPFLLNVWASWCPECRVEHPLIEQLAKNGVRVIGFNYKDEREDALRWLQQFGDPYALIVADESGRVAIDYGIYAAPETFLVDANGIVRHKVIGALTPQIIERDLLPVFREGKP